MIHNKDGDIIPQAYNKSGNTLDKVYDAVGTRIDIEKKEKDPYLDGRILLFEDDFDGVELDSNSWRKGSGIVRYEPYLTRNVSIENSFVHIKSVRENHLGYEWTTGGIDSIGKRSWLYGRFDAKVKCASVEGLSTGVWCIGNNACGAGNFYGDDNGVKHYEPQTEGSNGAVWPLCGEIDFIELLPGNTKRPPCNMYDANGQSMGSTRFPYDIDTKEWHIYSMEWTPDYIAILYDNVEFKRYTFNDYDESAIRVYKSIPMCLLITNSIGPSAGTVPSSVNQIDIYVDWVRVYAPIGAQSITLESDISIPSTLSIEKGKTVYFWTEFTPAYASDQHVTWISEDESIVICRDGWICGVEVGQTRIYVVSKNKKIVHCDVTVTQPSN